MAMTAAAPYPVTFDVEYPEAPNRWLILVRWLLAIPHYIVLYFVQLVALVFIVIAFFTILFAKTFPTGMFNFVVGYLRWYQNVWFGYLPFRDEYPPFSMREGAYAPVTVTIERPAEYNRWLVLVKLIFAIPHLIVLAALQVVGFFVFIYMLLAVLFTGRYPRGAFDFLVGVGRWYLRVDAYILLLVDRYPPFSMK
jgi:hypothetical protein